MQVYDPPLNVQGAPPSPVPSIGQGKTEALVDIYQSVCRIFLSVPKLMELAG